MFEETTRPISTANFGALSLCLFRQIIDSTVTSEDTGCSGVPFCYDILLITVGCIHFNIKSYLSVQNLLIRGHRNNNAIQSDFGSVKQNVYFLYFEHFILKWTVKRGKLHLYCNDLGHSMLSCEIILQCFSFLEYVISTTSLSCCCSSSNKLFIITQHTSD